MAVTLAKLAKAVHYTVSVAAPEADRDSFPDADVVQTDLDLGGMKITPQTLIVVSTQGHQDEEAVEHALRSAASYVAFVASRTKTAKIIDYLKDRGLDLERLVQLRAPAGLNIQAGSPEEIAVSILAEMIQVNRSAKEKLRVQASLPVIATQEAKDPICGMAVDIARAKHKSEFRGSTFYFCCAGCKQKFDKQPEQYIVAAAP